MNIQTIRDAGYAEALFEDAKEAAFSEARASFTPIVNEVSERGSRYYVTKHGKPTAAIVPINDLLRLMQLDRADRNSIDIDFTASDDVVAFEERKGVLDECEAQRVAKLVTAVSQIPGVREYLDNEKCDDDKQDNFLGGSNSEQENDSEIPAIGY